ncbi:hypothetical protein IVW58_28660 [Salmonella enterica subsp. enterica serovar Worthington]|nr:hypothetical protein [Salmonella enterica subsp. enterica serovar Worthington]
MFLPTGAGKSTVAELRARRPPDWYWCWRIEKLVAQNHANIARWGWKRIFRRRTQSVRESGKVVFGGITVGGA